MSEIWQHVAHLPSKHAAVVRWIYEEGLTNREVAGLLKLCESRVSRIHSEALQMLRVAIQGAGQ